MKRTLALLLATLLTLAAAGCAATPKATAQATATPPQATAAPEPTATATAAPTASPTATPAALTDFLGNPIKLENPPTRIISLTPSNTEIVYALGLGSKLVGVDAFSDYPDAVKDVAKIGDFNGPNLETVVSLKPDLVLGGNKLQKDAIDKMKALGLNVVSAEATTYEDIYKSIDLIAGLTGTQAKAAEVEADMKAKEKAVLDAVAKATGDKSVYYAMSYGDAGNYTCGPGSFPYELIEMCGGKNITEGLPVPWPNLSQEQLVKADPDVILLDSGMIGENSKDTFTKADAYKNLKAVKDGQVFVVTSNYCTRPGPRIVYGLREFAEAVIGQKIAFPGE